MAETYTAKDIEQLTGVTRHRLKHYYNSNLLSGVEGRVGTGRSRQFTRQNVIEVSVVDLLSRHGYTYPEIHEIMDQMECNEAFPGEDESAPEVLFVESRWEAWLIPRDEVYDMRLSGDSVHIMKYTAPEGMWK